MNDNDIIQAMKTKYPKLSATADNDILWAAKIKHANLFTSPQYQQTTTPVQERQAFTPQTTPTNWLPAGFVVDQPQQAPNKFVQQAKLFGKWLISWWSEQVIWTATSALWEDPTKLTSWIWWVPSPAWLLTPFLNKVWEKVQEIATPEERQSLSFKWGKITSYVAPVLFWAVKAAPKIKEIKTKWKLLDIIRETETLWNKRKWLPMWNTIDQPTWFKKWWSWWWDIVQPSQRSKDAVDTIQKVIKWASNKPVELYHQVDTKIWQVWSKLWWNLKKIWVNSTNKSTLELTNSIDDIANEMSDYSKNTANKIKTLWSSIKKATDANQYWDWLKKLDDSIPDNIKDWIDLSGKDQLIYNAWRKARWAGNDLLDYIWSNIKNVKVKQDFKIMKDLFHAKWQIRTNIWKLTKPTVWMKTKLIRWAKNTAKLAAWWLILKWLLSWWKKANPAEYVSE